MSREFTEFPSPRRYDREKTKKDDEEEEEEESSRSLVFYGCFVPRIDLVRRVCASTSSWYSGIKTSNFSECGISQFFIPSRSFARRVYGELAKSLPIDCDFSTACRLVEVIFADSAL